MRVLVTGAEGFVGRNLCVRLREIPGMNVMPIGRGSTAAELEEGVASADALVHLAAVNRPTDPAEFMAGNRDLTAAVAALVARRGGGVPVLLSSSTQAERDNPYGHSKRAAEDALLGALPDPVASAHVFRLPNVFGKWCRPNYNSAVATFCHNIARGLPINIHDPSAPLSLVYVDDVVDAFLAILAAHGRGESLPGGPFRTVEPVYSTTVGTMADSIRRFHETRHALGVEAVGSGFLRALYATYLSYLPPGDFSYPIPVHVDPRGAFAEMLRTRDSGQVSFFTAHPGVTRGGHYHHTKNEKFLVVNGRARFRFRNVVTGEAHELETEGGRPEIVDTVPGWAHDVTNVGDSELVVLLWANEVLDRERPDTIPSKL
jgi:UDP-2-acetamido-2,6-beta-L-arabino-hexul-4-ose reductase